MWKRIHPKDIHWPSGWQAITNFTCFSMNHFLYDQKSHSVTLLKSNGVFSCFYRNFNLISRSFSSIQHENLFGLPNTPSLIFRNQFVFIAIDGATEPGKYFISAEEPQIQEFTLPRVPAVENHLFTSCQDQVYGFFYSKKVLHYCAYNVSPFWAFELIQREGILLPLPLTLCSDDDHPDLESVLVTEGNFIFLFVHTNFEEPKTYFTVVIYHRDTQVVSEQNKRECPMYSDLSLHHVSDRVFLVHVRGHAWILCNMKNQIFLIADLHSDNYPMMICGNLETQSCFSLVRNLQQEYFFQQLK